MTDNANPGTAPAATPEGQAPSGNTPDTNSNPTPQAGQDQNPTPAPSSTPTPAPQPSTDPSDIEEPAVKDSDWVSVRAKIANGDPKIEARLARYSSVESAIEALISAQNKIAQGVTKTAFPKDGSPEEMAAWRTENGVPDSPEGYDLTLEEGVVMGEEDKPLVDDFLKHAHAENYTPAQVNAAVNWYMNMREEEANAIAENDANLRISGEEAVRELWGAETQLNKQIIMNLMNSAPDGLGDLLLSGRLGDGTPIFSHPGALRWFADHARALNPLATVVPGHGQNASQAMEDEISNIEKLMRDKESDYWKGPKANQIQERYRKLLDARERTKVT